MVKSKLGKNTLPLLAITALLLSVALVNYDQSLVANSNNTQSVLSESDESEDRSDEDKSEEDKKEDEKQEDREETSTRNRETERVEKREVKKETKSLNAKPETIKVEEEIEIEEEDINDGQSNSDNDSSDNEVESEFEQESETTSSDGAVNRFKLKIKTKTVAGKTIVQTASGEVEVENSPEDAINSLVENGLIDEPLSFEAKVNNREKVEFEIQGTDSKRFLGIFNVVIPKTLTVSSETGEVVSTNQNVWSRILSLLSI